MPGKSPALFLSQMIDLQKAMRSHHYPADIQLCHSLPLDSDGAEPLCSLQQPSPE